MFARRSDASKVAFVHLVTQLKEAGYRLIDCQIASAHLAHFGAESIPRRRFIEELREACVQPVQAVPWNAAVCERRHARASPDHHPHRDAVCGRAACVLFFARRGGGDAVRRPESTHVHRALQRAGGRRLPQQRRVWRRNQDLAVQITATRTSDEHFSLYRRYMAARHPGGGMDVSDPEQYRAFLFSPWSDTRCLEFRAGDHLLAVAIIDRLRQGWSAVYTYYEPDEAQRSLGTFAVLWQIEQCQGLALPWVYLGYWIPECVKMRYKVQFQPLEVFREGRWQVNQRRDAFPSA